MPARGRQAAPAFARANTSTLAPRGVPRARCQRFSMRAFSRMSHAPCTPFLERRKTAARCAHICNALIRREKIFCACFLTRAFVRFQARACAHAGDRHAPFRRPDQGVAPHVEALRMRAHRSFGGAAQRHNGVHCAARAAVFLARAAPKNPFFQAAKYAPCQAHASVLSGAGAARKTRQADKNCRSFSSARRSFSRHVLACAARAKNNLRTCGAEDLKRWDFSTKINR
jgi:hypothetical protein